MSPEIVGVDPITLASNALVPRRKLAVRGSIGVLIYSSTGAEQSLNQTATSNGPGDGRLVSGSQGLVD